jgi:nitric oxide reductase NorQ protein
MSNNNEMNTVLELRPMSNFVETDYVKDITNRGLIYIKAGFPVHFRGPSGTGKTTVAMHLASKIGRPVVIIHGDAEYKTSDLIGSEQGYRYKKLDDKFIHSVHKYEEDMSKQWVNNRLTIAVKNGFTRSRPEANNILLPILQERMLSTSAAKEEDYYMKVHPEFRAIFTSNPEEYAGVNRTQDALRDRMVTMDLDHFDYETELKITMAKSELSMKDTEVIVKIVRGLRESGIRSDDTWFDYDCQNTCNFKHHPFGIKRHIQTNLPGYSHFRNKPHRFENQPGKGEDYR